MQLYSQIRGCFLWSALGDAIGSSFELKSEYSIRETFQNKIESCGLDKAIVSFIKEKNITDDTLMTLYQTQSLIEEGKFDPVATARRFADWYRSGKTPGIGYTTREALQKLTRGVPWYFSGREGSNAGGNGPAMRISPIGLMYHNKLDEMKNICANAAIITHNYSEGFAGAQAIALAVALGISGNNKPEDLFQKAIEYIEPSIVADKLNLAQKLFNEKVHPLQALQEIGCGAYIPETVASAIYCFAFYPTEPLEAITAAILAGGDTDTTAAIAGAISGAWNGDADAPAHWIKELDQIHWIESNASCLCGIMEKNEEQNN